MNDEYYDAVDGDSLGFGIHEFDPDEDTLLDDENDPLIPKKKILDEDEEDLEVLLKDFDLPDEDSDEFNPDLY